MEKRIKAYKVVAWIVVAILIAVQLFGWGDVVMSYSVGDDSGIVLMGIIFVFVPGLICTVLSALFLILSSKSGIPKPRHIVLYIVMSILAMCFNFIVLLMAVSTGPEEIYGLFLFFVLAMFLLNLIFSVRGCNAAKFLRRQAQAQKLYQQQFMDYQAYPQYQQPNQQYQQNQQ